jgi:pyrroloquinoline quinone biosynthesis protein B
VEKGIGRSRGWWLIGLGLCATWWLVERPVSVAHAGGVVPPVRAIVLGIAQDGGVPHIGCQQKLCVAARRDCTLRQRVASLGLVDDTVGRRFIVDATPDLPSQLASLNAGRVVEDRRRPVDGILLTHAHIGHYTGLMFLGREALGAKAVPVHVTPRMAKFLRDNDPWRQIVSLGHIQLREIAPGRELALTPSLRVTFVPVPHREELSDVMGIRVRGPKASLLYIPDVDKWQRWDRDLAQEVAGVDTALLDGSFESPSEIPGRDITDIPHPLVGETVALLEGVKRRVLFTHLNHTNRLLWDVAAREALSAKGFRVAVDGDLLPL